MRISLTRTMAALAAASFLATVAVADSGTLEGFKYSNILIKSVKDGKLVVSSTTGDKTYALKDVSLLNIDGQTAFNQAEEALAAKDYKKAATLYTQAITRINNKDQQLVAKARAIKPLDEDSRFADAVRYFLDVYEASPTPGTFDLHPTKLPAASSKLLTDAASAIESRLKNPTLKAPEAQKSLKTYLLEIYNKANDPKAAALAQELGGAKPAANITEEPATAATPATPTVAADTGSLRDVQAAITAKKYDDAVRLADNALRTATGENAAALYLAKAQALQQAKKLDEAAVTYLRIPAHFPTSPLAPAALLSAANIQKEQAAAQSAAGQADAAKRRSEEARRLYKEIVDKYPQSRQAAEAAKSAT